MPRLSDKRIAKAVIQAGFPRGTWRTAVAVALAESGGNSDATHRNSNGSTDYGLFQINSIHSALLADHNWRDPVDNARMALSISSNGSNWQPWVAWKSGAHRKYLPRAKAALDGLGTMDTLENELAAPGQTQPGPGKNPYWNVPEDPQWQGAHKSTDFFGLIQDPRTWVRFGLILVGGLIMLIALARVSGFADAAVSAAKVYATKGIVK